MDGSLYHPGGGHRDGRQDVPADHAPPEHLVQRLRVRTAVSTLVGAVRRSALAGSAQASLWRSSGPTLIASGRSRLLALAGRALAKLEAGVPGLAERGRAALPFLPWPAPAGAEGENPAQAVLRHFLSLPPEGHQVVARKVALLWDTFVQDFDGVSGFRSASATSRSAYLDRLEGAAQRMGGGQNPQAAVHYAAIEMTRLYVSSFLGDGQDEHAIALSERMASLIDRGRVALPKVEELEAQVQPAEPSSANAVNGSIALMRPPAKLSFA